MQLVCFSALQGSACKVGHVQMQHKVFTKNGKRDSFNFPRSCGITASAWSGDHEIVTLAILSRHVEG